MTLRVFLGISEGAFLPLVIHYLTTFYRRTELARRLAIFYAVSSPEARLLSGFLPIIRDEYDLGKAPQSLGQPSIIKNPPNI